GIWGGFVRPSSSRRRRAMSCSTASAARSIKPWIGSSANGSWKPETAKMKRRRAAARRRSQPLEPSVVRAWVGGRYPRLPRSWSQHHDDRAHFDVIVEVDHVFVGHPDAARRDRMPDPFRLVGAMDAVKRVPAAGVKVNPTGAHRIGGSAFDIIRE